MSIYISAIELEQRCFHYIIFVMTLNFILVANIDRSDLESGRNSKGCFQNFNFFPSVPPSTDARELRIQKIATIISIVLFIASLVPYIWYILLVTTPASTAYVQVISPTLETYAYLYRQYSSSITCPCSTISIAYQQFIAIQFTQHQICSSDFVTNDWINYLASYIQSNTVFTNDFRWTSVATFQGLSMFCKLTSSVTGDSLNQINSRQYVNAFVVPEVVIQTETVSIIDQYLSSITSRSLWYLTLIRQTTQINGLSSGRQTNYQLQVSPNDQSVNSYPKIFSKCSCLTSSTCIDQSSIYDYPSGIKLFSVPGIYTGCYVIEALLQSTLECFYNQACINRLLYYYPSLPPMHVKALDSPTSSYFYANTSIQQLVSQLMLEDWTIRISYAKYYAACNPTHCSYRDATARDVVTRPIIILSIAFAGGVITILKLFMQLFVKLIICCIRRQRTQSLAQTVIVGRS